MVLFTLSVQVSTIESVVLALAVWLTIVEKICEFDCESRQAFEVSDL